MKTFIITFYDWDEEFEYERWTLQFPNYAEMMEFAERRCQEAMKEHNVDEMCWHYEEV